MKIIGAAVILIAGIVAGIMIARYLPSQPTTPPATQPGEVSRPNQARVPLAPATVTLRAYNDRNLHRESLAIVVGQPPMIVARTMDFAGAARVEIETAKGEVAQTVAVVATNDLYGLAALAPNRPLAAASLEPEPGAGSLYLGRRLELLGRGDQTAAEVYSAGLRDELGAYRYTLKFAAPGAGPAFAVIEPGTTKLLGVIAGEQSDAYASAYDSEPVNRLIDRIGQDPVRTLSEFARYHFGETTHGRLELLRQLVASEQYDSAIDAGKNMLNLDAYTQLHGAPLLRQAYAGAARRAVDSGQWGVALNLLQDAERTTGMDDTLRLLRADANQAIGELGRALDDLLALEQNNAQRIRTMVIENALSAGQTGGQSSLTMLERALADDPDYAPYHRLLGETLARQGDMAGALAALERAIQLDPGLATELLPLLERLQARRNTPLATEVPIQRRRNTLYVDARINGSTQTFRLLLDTGASYTAITAETALRLGINNIFFGAPVVELQTANGRVYTTTATLGSIDVSGARVDNVEAVILESMSGVDGLLGQSFLRHFDVNIDRSRGVIAFNRRIDN